MTLRAALPAITGSVTVSFKHEDEVVGEPVGPVVVIDRARYDAWLDVHGISHVNARGEIKRSPPFGSKPEGRHNLGWLTKRTAHEIARHYGVALEEF